LETAPYFSDVLGIGSASVRFTIMGSNGCAGAKDLLADNLGFRRFWQRRVKPDDSQSEFLGSHPKIAVLFVLPHSSVLFPPSSLQVRPIIPRRTSRLPAGTPDPVSASSGFVEEC
jgi:hypothetical protein